MATETTNYSQKLARVFRIGSAIGALHAALAEYPWPVKSYEHDLLNTMPSKRKVPEPVRSFLVG